MRLHKYAVIAVASVALISATPLLAASVPKYTYHQYNQVATYYPSVSASTYYVLPGQAITFSGRDFAPSDTITITAPRDTGVMNVTASSNGSFINQGFYVVPFAFADSRQTFTLTSNQSGKSFPITVVVGTFYPNLNPDSYYVARGSQGQASVEGFAPGELVELMVNGKVVATAHADSVGRATMNYSVPTYGTTFLLMAAGRASHTESDRTITLQGPAVYAPL
ncbi:MAG: hypothetical protein JWO43_93 [Candidatus Adlerbacteria bacterium]|nr:hypothetical protein [Candidatus Adlerbacteria bacterium]